MIIESLSKASVVRIVGVVVRARVVVIGGVERLDANAVLVVGQMEAALLERDARVIRFEHLRRQHERD